MPKVNLNLFNVPSYTDGSEGAITMQCGVVHIRKMMIQFQYMSIIAVNGIWDSIIKAFPADGTEYKAMWNFKAFYNVFGAISGMLLTAAFYASDKNEQLCQLFFYFNSFVEAFAKENPAYKI